MIVLGPPLAKIRQLHARRPPRVLGPIDMHRRDPDPRIRRHRLKVQPKAIIHLRPHLRIVHQILSTIPQPLPDLDTIQIRRQLRQRPRPRLEQPHRLVVDVPRALRDVQPEVVEGFERQATAEEDGGAEGEWLCWRLEGVVEQVGADEAAALGEAHDGVVGAVLGDVVVEPLVRAADGVGGGLRPEGVGAGVEDDFDAGGRGAVEGGVDKVEFVILGEFGAEGNWGGVRGGFFSWLFW